MDKNIILDNLSLWINLGVGGVLFYINSRFSAIKRLIDNEKRERERLEKRFERCKENGVSRGEKVARIQGRLNGKS